MHIKSQLLIPYDGVRWAVHAREILWRLGMTPPPHTIRETSLFIATASSFQETGVDIQVSSARPGSKEARSSIHKVWRLRKRGYIFRSH